MSSLLPNSSSSFLPTSPTSTPITPFSLEEYPEDHFQNLSYFHQLHLLPPTHLISFIRLSPPIQPHLLRFVLCTGSIFLPDAILVLTSFSSSSNAKEENAIQTNGTHEILKIEVNEFHGIVQKSYFISFQYDRIHHAFAEITLTTPGLFEYFIQSSSTPLQRTEKGCILMDPILKVKGKTLPHLDAIVLQTIIPKWLGPLSTWDSPFSVISELGFNMVHFVPLQQRGASNSPYSLKDFLEFSEDLFEGSSYSREEKRHQVQSKLSYLNTQLGVLCMTDIVWNHASHDASWLREHPECGYNLLNSPHLIPAFELDEAILQFSKDLDLLHLPRELHHESELKLVLDTFRSTYFQNLKLWEYFVLNATVLLQHFKDAYTSFLLTSPVLPSTSGDFDFPTKKQMLLQSTFTELPFGSTRFTRSLTISKCVPLLYQWSTHPTDVQHVVNEFETLVNAINLEFYQVYDALVTRVFGNLASTVKWQRLDPSGPRRGPIHSHHPLVDTYFTRGKDPEEEDDDKAHTPKETTSTPTPTSPPQTLRKDHFPYIWANNGWIWNANPCMDFASSSSLAYLQREVIVWGDCVKLKYGEGPTSNPWLWDYMRTYTCEMARLFQGFRIDNCHSTPLHVAKYFLHHARQVNPNLYIIAELFTGDPGLDRLFVSELGIHSLIREAMQAWDVKEFSRLIHRYSGKPIGSFEPITMSGKPTPLKQKEPHAILMDCTHDNDPPSVKRQTSDTLPNAALVNFSRCAVGSVLGYDFCIPKHLNIVTEHRKYPPLSMALGMHVLRKKLSLMNQAMVGMSEIYVHQEGQYIIVARQHPKTHDGITLIAYPAFFPSSEAHSLQPVQLSKSQAQLCMAQRLIPTGPAPPESSSPYILGMPIELIHLDHSIHVTHQDRDQHWHVAPNTFPGSIFILKTKVNASTSIRSLQALQQGPPMTLVEACRSLSLYELGDVLFRCQGETTLGVYVVPGYGPLSYCGLEGIAGILRTIVDTNDLSHPLCTNLREGTWLLDYTVDRLPASTFRSWLGSMVNFIKEVPNYLVPKYFALLVLCSIKALRRVVWEKLGQGWSSSSSFIRRLALTSIQLVAMPPGVSLHPTLPMPCLAAGFPHFALDFMRCWGRDIFISLKGLFMLTGQFELAKSHLVAFASVLRHGLIPNLLDSGRYPRYNARDAVWWFLYALQAYTDLAPNPNELLFMEIPRRFPTDQWIPHDHPSSFATSWTMMDVVYTILQRHVEGIDFVEWNAGPALDHAMRPEGFHVQIHVDASTGFVKGGNLWNCGTWMDKMGDSGATHGFPATPRDGAPIEITALVYSTLMWLQTLVDRKWWKVTGVTVPPSSTGSSSSNFWSWGYWAELIHQHFEPLYYVPPLMPTEVSSTTSDVLTLEMYKDVVGSNRIGADVQFRPNQFLAMAIAPQLFHAEHALAVLRQGEALIGPLGMKTLHPSDPMYAPYYDPKYMGPDERLVHGYNYHQGPEWGWLLGYYLRAYLHFSPNLDLHWIQVKLQPAHLHLKRSVWSGLPELTNANGQVCQGSCNTQAWSNASFLEVAHEVMKRASASKNKN
ncbi:hypothetical protein HMI55_003689 [Coelomomyces lativittatus]|nr:hypothetical protein HMI55_003689 [Coelomomyces lativittatus]